MYYCRLNIVSLMHLDTSTYNSYGHAFVGFDRHFRFSGGPRKTPNVDPQVHAGHVRPAGDMARMGR